MKRHGVGQINLEHPKIQHITIRRRYKSLAVSRMLFHSVFLLQCLIMLNTQTAVSWATWYPLRAGCKFSLLHNTISASATIKMLG